MSIRYSIAAGKHDGLKQFKEHLPVLTNFSIYIKETVKAHNTSLKPAFSLHYKGHVSVSPLLLLHLIRKQQYPA